ncbi:unnamed protein product [Soboliphyme baturini]|uniref:Hist_deacetyl domain-containing protein n=1 Tax=Soboliphyme baturini TaxID=241478 RepID=A0A183IK37_9BILA|nr:unnamed protein product [Soboliphyme baturini]
MIEQEDLEKDNEQPYFTGVSYDEKFCMHACPWSELHIEKPARFTRSLEKCAEWKLLDRCMKIQGRQATREELMTVHSKEYIDLISSCSSKNNVELKAISSEFNDAYVSIHTFDVASFAVGSLLEAVNSVMTSQCRNAFALVRPPGHHALFGEANGFSIFNNVAIACEVALRRYGLKRVLVVDFDVHHGQGIQRAFYDSHQVMYVSIHRYEYGLFWPHLKESNWDYFVLYLGFGYNINIPLNKCDLGDAEYLAVFHHLILPLATEFSPELTFICAGYDAAVGCPDGHMKVNPQTYGHLVQMLCCLATGRVIASLEGGYCLDSLAYSVAFSVRALLQDPCLPLPPIHDGVDPLVVEVVLNIASTLRSKWKSMDYFMRTVNHCLSRIKAVTYFASEATYKYIPGAVPTCSCEVNTPSNPELLRAVMGYLSKEVPLATNDKRLIGIAYDVPDFEPVSADSEAFSISLPTSDPGRSSILYVFLKEADCSRRLTKWISEYGCLFGLF